MPVRYPVVPGHESYVPRRIQAKYETYRYLLGDDPHPVANTYNGERYEIVVAADMCRRNRFTDGNQISRWTSRTEGGSQSVTIGHNTEYDFVFPNTDVFANFAPGMHVQGAVLGEAKSYAHGLGAYIKKAATYCLHDPAGLAGFCFVTPQAQEAFWPTLVRNTYAVLANPDAESAGIAGGPGWRNRAAVAGKPAGATITGYFARYRAPNPAVPANLHVAAINTELATFAGFVIICYQAQQVPDAHLGRYIHGL